MSAFLISAIVLIIFALLLMKVKVYTLDWNEDIFGKENFKKLQGVTALFIMMHHVALQMPDWSVGLLYVFAFLGTCFTGIFFFCSGFGLVISLNKNENYLNHFIFKRFTSILVPFYVCTGLNLLYDWMSGSLSGGFTFVFKLTGLQLEDHFMWFIPEIAIFYIAFYLIYRYIKDGRKAFISMGAFIVSFIVLSLLLCHGKYWLQGEWWYDSSILFWLGMFVAYRKESLVVNVKKNYCRNLFLFS